MIAYLESEDVTRPSTIDSAAKREGDEALGTVTSTIGHGELFLHPTGDKTTWLRLRWSPDDADRTRPLAPGTYVVTGYRRLATAEDGTPWIWSTTSPGYRTLEVKAGDTVHVEVRDWIGLDTRAVFRKGKHRVGLLFLAEKKLGNTLYRGGKRIGIRWQLRDALGEVLDEGPMGYG